MLCSNIGINESGHLTFAGEDTVRLAAHYKTPLYLMDEDRIRENCRVYKAAMARAFGEGSFPLYASKAASFKRIYAIMQDEGMAIDVVSAGEIATAKRAGFQMERAFFHGNNKTDADLVQALDMGVGTIVADNEDELCALSALAAAKGVCQRILLRITPGIDPHTHKAIRTGNVDSKFGSAIATGQAAAIVKKALSLRGVRLAGFHCHIGSQIFDITPFADAAGIMMDFIAAVKKETGFEAEELNLGGGLGVPYTEYDRTVDYAAAIGKIAENARAHAARAGVALPRVILEPGRSLVAAAGITLYTVGSVKEIPGFRNYVSIDGGMPDNPRYALYQSTYTVLIANRAGAPKDYRATIAGRCCESGDLIGENLPLQKPQRGDILAVLTTGAYNYSMASNYNRIPRPPVILVKDGTARVAVRRESFEDLVRNDL